MVGIWGVGWVGGGGDHVSLTTIIEPLFILLIKKIKKIDHKKKASDPCQRLTSHPS